MSSPSANDPAVETDIAIVGMTCRFPGARNLEEFWENLRAGVESVTFLTDEELEAAGVERATLRRPNYVKAAALLEGADLFDAAFFGITPREAELIDPQHRIFLECAWEALEDAGYDAERYDGWIGVYAGAGFNSYLSNQLHANRELLTSLGHLQALISNEKDYLTSRVSYKLNLKGPSVNVQTACSTSLAAVHLSCQSLLTYQCDMALAGGVSVHAPQKAGYLYVEDGIQSPDGHTRSFDARGQGTLFGSGVGVVVLKRLADALEDGDRVHAVIKGTAMNNDGSLKVGYTAPSVDGLSKVIAMALGNAGVRPETVSYVEAHGTATALGDPVELAALNKAFRALRGQGASCALGSVKTNFGHLNVAAGVAGLIKTVLSLKHGQIPPSLHFERPNPAGDWEQSPFRVNTRLSEWGRGPEPRRAGINSMGIGGTNVHVVVEEAPEPAAPDVARPWHLLVLSAKTETALEAATERLAAHLEREPGADLADIAYTLQVGRKGFARRRALACRDAPDAVAALRARDPRRVSDGTQADEERPVVFLFPGQGSQYVNAGRALYEGEPAFRRQVEKCAALLGPRLGFDLRDVLYPPPGREEEADERLQQTAVAQPALFAVEHALATLLLSWGVRPWAMVGHSVGEYVAACLAGVFGLEEGLGLVSARGRLMQGVAAGSMLAVPLPAAELEGMAPEGLSLAATNGDSQCVVSGGHEAVAEFEQRLASRGVECRRLRTSHAFHSGMMDGILDAFTGEVRKVALRAPQLPYVSNVTGRWITGDETTDAAYWARHLRGTVRFAESVRLLLAERAPIFVEVGPGETLSSLAKQLAGEGAAALPTLGHRREPGGAHGRLLKTLGGLWTQGREVKWDAYYAGESRRRVPLPTYPFERQRFWVEAQRRPSEGAGAPKSLRKRTDVAEWFYVPSWKRSVPPDCAPTLGRAGDEGRDCCWLIFADDRGLGSQLARRLGQEGLTVFTAGPGELYARDGERGFTVNPRSVADYSALLNEIGQLGGRLTNVVHAWCVSGGSVGADGGASFERTQSLGFYSLLALARALGQRGEAEPLSIAVLTEEVQQVTGDEKLRPEQATALGPCKVVPQEYPHIACRSIDVSLPPRGSAGAAALVEMLAAELSAGSKDQFVAYRHGLRWVQTFEPHRIEEPDGRASGLREGGVYLITGGLGGIGLVLAEHLAQSVRARLVLVGRTPFPPHEGWPRWLAEHGAADVLSGRIRKLQELESYGAQVLVESADVTDEGQMRGVLDRARSRFGQINGVVHAAGVPGGGVIQLRTPESAAPILAPKVQGTRVLGRLFAGGGLDFMLLCSSTVAVLGGYGQVDYCAGNSFLDAFAHSNTAGGHARTIAVDWDGWQDVGMLVETEARYGVGGAAGADAGEQPARIAPREGADAFARILARRISPQVVVSTKDLAASFERVGAFAPEHVSREIERLQAERPGPLHPRPEVQAGYVAPSNEFEQTIADIWQALFGVERVGVHDDFFELGGNSLLGIQLASRLRDFFQVEIPLGQLFETPTVSHLALLVSQKLAQKEPDAMAELLAELDGLSEEEALRQLDSGG